MPLSDFDYDLPERLIAHAPAKRRDASRLLVVRKKINDFEHRYFFDIVDYFSAGDVLVLNDSKVIPARLLGKKKTGGQVEIFLARRLTTKKDTYERWECLIRGKRLETGIDITMSSTFKATLMEKQKETWVVEFNKHGKSFYAALERHGKTPLPPYIKSDEKQQKKNYQTVYASDKHKGSVAAPTAGLHFTPKLLQKLKQKGVIIKTITLHVGLGTFLPIRVMDYKKHEMHSEWVEVKAEVMKAIQKAHQQKKKVIAVGTSTTRALEAAYKEKKLQSFNGWVNIFIYPPYKFNVINGLVTNFHLPKSTLLLLVSALAGKKRILSAYKAAIKQEYRFFSFGDAMLIV